MRFAPLAALVLFVGCGPGTDPLVGSYTFTMTGSDTNTGSSTSTNTSGVGTIAITTNALMTGYVITTAHTDASPCIVEGSAPEKATAPELTFKVDQKCVFVNGGTTTTVTFTSSKATLKQDAMREKDVITLDVAYSYAGTTTIFGLTSSFSGTGKRTYTGTRR